MPRTRAQRRHALATALDEDTLSYILSFLPKLGVVPGRFYTLSGSGPQPHMRWALAQSDPRAAAEAPHQVP